jgi:hypothetical protein
LALLVGSSNGFATSLMLESKENYGVTDETFFDLQELLSGQICLDTR